MAEHQVPDDSWVLQYERHGRLHGSVDEALAYFQRIFDDAPAPYLITNPQLLITDANAAAQRMLNRSIENMHGKPLYLFVSPSERQVFRTMARAIIDAGDSLVRPLCIQPDGSAETDVIFSARVVRGADNEVDCIFWLFVHSITPEGSDLL